MSTLDPLESGHEEPLRHPGQGRVPPHMESLRRAKAGRAAHLAL
jgi:hypothetical protein